MADTKWSSFEASVYSRAQTTKTIPYRVRVVLNSWCTRLSAFASQRARIRKSFHTTEEDREAHNSSKRVFALFPWKLSSPNLALRYFFCSFIFLKKLSIIFNCILSSKLLINWLFLDFFFTLLVVYSLILLWNWFFFFSI